MAPGTGNPHVLPKQYTRTSVGHVFIAVLAFQVIQLVHVFVVVVSTLISYIVVRPFASSFLLVRRQTGLVLSLNFLDHWPRKLWDQNDHEHRSVALKTLLLSQSTDLSAASPPRFSSFFFLGLVKLAFRGAWFSNM